MRFVMFCALLLAWGALESPSVLAQSANAPAFEAAQVKRASAIAAGHGAVVLSIRSEIYLEEPLDVYFLREGGNIANASDVISFRRKQSFFAFGNSTVEYQVRTYHLRAGTYRLIAHGIDCPKIPAENERCLVDRSGLTGTVEVSRPSRGYGEGAPTFEVREGMLTNAGDFALTARNTIEWSAIPPKDFGKAIQRFRGLQSGPDPVIPDGFRLKYGLFPRSFEDDRGRRY